jgi:hypothetical protein
MVVGAGVLLGVGMGVVGVSVPLPPMPEPEGVTEEDPPPLELPPL